MERDVYERLAEVNEAAWTPDGYEGAFIGIGYRFGEEPIAVYDYWRCIGILEGQGMTHDEAVEFFDYNVVGCYPGKEGTLPVFVEMNEPEDE